MVTPNKIIDIHTHILPGVDDGAKTLADSIRILRWLANQGVTDVIATPHYIDETEYNSSRSTNLKILDNLKSRLEADDIPVNVYLGNEIYIDDKIAELILAGKISAMADSKYLLVELPMNDEFLNYEDYLCDLMNKGYKIVLAHPERYSIIQKNYKIAKKLHKMGVLFQCNFGSLIGKYGINARRTIRKMARDKIIFAFGSDVHHCGRKDYITLACEKLLRYYTKREISQLLMINPEKILKNIIDD